MIGLDTNILVRYLAQDDPVQSPKATELIERQLTEENPGFVSVVAMVETVWVLDRAYGLADHAIAAAIERALRADVLIVESEQEVFAAERRTTAASGSKPRLPFGWATTCRKAALPARSPRRSKAAWRQSS